MIKKCFFIATIICCIFFFSFVEIKKKEKVYVEILNMDTITNGAMVEFKITNNSNKNYCFLIDTVSYKMKDPYLLESSTMKNDIFHLYDDKNEGVIFELKDNACKYNEEVIKSNKKINYKKTINNLIKVKSKSCFTYKLKFNSNVFYNDFCWGKFLVNQKSNYFLRLDLKYYDVFLNNEMKDSINKLGYKIYTKELTSNKVPFKIK